MSRAAACVDRVEQLGIPLGWRDAANRPDTVGQGFGKLLGLLVTAFALTLGAPFWFDVLSRLSRLRASGPRELPSQEEARATSAPEGTPPAPALR